MKFVPQYKKYLLLALLTLGTVCSYAGGFPTRPGSLLISPSVNYFFANKQFDSLGVKKPFPDNGKFNSVYISLYTEYGISRRFTFVGSLPYVINNYQQDGKTFASSGLTDMETGIKYYLANINYKYYFSLQATAITPLYTNPNLGYQEEGAEFKVAFACSGTMLHRDYYFTLENGIRQYFGDNGPVQDRYTGTFGLTLDKKSREQIAVSLGGFYTVSNLKKFNAKSNLSKDFSFKQASISYGHSFSKDFTVFLTGGTFIAGRNTGAGSSAAVSIVYKIGS